MMATEASKIISYSVVMMGRDMNKAIITLLLIATFFTGNAFAAGLCHNPKGDSKPGEPATVIYNADRKNNDEEQDLRFALVHPDDGAKKVKRPLIIGIHGGGFANTCFLKPCYERYLENVLVPEFVPHGFAVAAVQYRLNSPLDFLPSRIKAEKVREMHYKATQDTRQAIKYIFDNAEKLNIDTENVFVIGVSAGAITALHSVYATRDTVRDELVKEFGELEPVQNIRGVVSISGALYDISKLKSGPRVPLMIVHGRNDVVVPAEKGFYFGLERLEAVYGGKAIFDEATKLKLPVTGHFYDVGHAFPKEIAADIFEKSRRFAVANINCETRVQRATAN